MGIKGKYFIITNKHSGLVMDIQSESQSPGTPVILWEKHGHDNQVWYEDPVTGTIRSKLDNNLCLDLGDSNRLVVNHYNAGDKNQQWHYDKKRKVIENKAERDRVLGVEDESSDPGASVCSSEHKGDEHQRWKIHALPIKYFYIKSELNGKVLDIDNGSAEHGAKVIMYPKKGEDADNQLWFEDCFGNIRSKLNPKLVLNGSGDCMHTGEYSHDDNKVFWAIQGKKIVNVHNPNEVLDIKDENQDDCAELCAWGYHSGQNQHWDFEYI